jgi:tetratricopeptide (TPR) repeat protein
MKRANSVRARTAAEIFLLVLCFSLPVASPARADKKFDAREQFMRAVKLRTALEGQPQKDRTLSDYKQAINAYHKVYLVSPQAEEVTPSLIAEAELYGEMGRLYDPKYFGNAIECYNFLLKQYPGSRYRAEAIFTIGLIQKNDLNQPDAAEATLKEFVRRFPTSDKAPAAREFLKEIAQERTGEATSDRSTKGRRRSSGSSSCDSRRERKGGVGNRCAAGDQGSGGRAKRSKRRAHPACHQHSNLERRESNAHRRNARGHDQVRSRAHRKSRTNLF